VKDDKGSVAGFLKLKFSCLKTTNLATDNWNGSRNDSERDGDDIS